MPPVSIRRWKMALISMEDIALSLRGHLHAGTLNVDYINSQLQPTAQMQLQLLEDHQSMEKQEEIDELEAIREEAESKKRAAERKTANKGKQPPRQPAVPKKTSKIYPAPARQSSRLRSHQTNVPEAEFLFDLDSAKDIAISPPSTRSSDHANKKIHELDSIHAKQEPVANEMDVDGPPVLEINVSASVPDEINPIDTPQHVLVSVSGESTFKDGDADTEASLNHVISGTKDLRVIDPEQHPDTDLNNTLSSRPEGTGVTVIQEGSSQHPNTASKASPNQPSSIQIPASGIQPLTPALKEDNPVSLSTASYRKSPASTNSTPLRRYAILNDAKMQLRVKRERSPPSNTSLRVKTVPREPNGRIMKRENWPEEVAAKRAVSYGGVSVKSHTGQRVDSRIKLSAGKDSQSKDHASKKTGDADDHETQRPVKRPKLRLYLKTEQADA